MPAQNAAVRLDRPEKKRALKKRGGKSETAGTWHVVLKGAGRTSFDIVSTSMKIFWMKPWRSLSV
jgi:hypothetical protein